MFRASRLLAAPALALSLSLAFLFWRWMGAPVAVPDAPGTRLQCLSYTPSEPDNLGALTPGWVSTARIESDLDILGRYTNCLRLYTPLGTTPRVVEAAARRNLQILLGAWIGRDRDQNEKEITAGLELARRYPQTVSTLVVGNEVLLRREMPAGQLAALITSVKAQSPVPVAYADVAHFIEESPPVAAAADLLLIHLLPYWDDPQPPPADKAADQVIRQYHKFRTRFPGKAIMIGETGWPSKGRMRGPGKPSIVNEARFVREFATRALDAGIRYNLIEAIDQPWKRPAEGTVGGYWGLLDDQRHLKFPLQGPVSGWPDWQRPFTATAIIILGFCLAGLRRNLSTRAWASWSLLALALGLALVFQWDYLHATRVSAWSWLGSGIAAAMTAAAAILIGAALSGSAPGEIAALAELGRSRYRVLTIIRTPALHRAVLVAVVMTAAAWISLALAFAARHRDIPIAHFLLPALAMSVCVPWVRRGAAGDHREEAMLAAVILIGGLMQVEWNNPETLAWLAICALIGAPWLRSLGAELARVRRLFTDARQAQQNAQHP